MASSSSDLTSIAGQLKRILGREFAPSDDFELVEDRNFDLLACGDATEIPNDVPLAGYVSVPLSVADRFFVPVDMSVSVDLIPARLVWVNFDRVAREIKRETVFVTGIPCVVQVSVANPSHPPNPPSARCT